MWLDRFRDFRHFRCKSENIEKCAQAAHFCHVCAKSIYPERSKPSLALTRQSTLAGFSMENFMFDPQPKPQQPQPGGGGGGGWG